MKVILLKEVKGRGGEGDVITVKDGFANNYLLKEGFAVKATKGNLKQLEERRANIQKREEKRIEEAKELQEQLNNLKFKVDVQIGEEGQLFGSVTPQMIVDGIKKKTGIVADRRRVDIRKSIRSVGLHQAEYTIYRDIKAALQIIVGAENAEKFLEEMEAKKKGKKQRKNKKEEKKAEKKVEAESDKDKKPATEEKPETEENNTKE